MTLLFPLCPNHSSACCFQLVKNAFLQTDFTKFILVRIGAKVSFSEKPSMQMYFSLIFLCTRSLISIMISETSTFRYSFSLIPAAFDRQPPKFFSENYPVHYPFSLNSYSSESRQKYFLVKIRQCRSIFH